MSDFVKGVIVVSVLLLGAGCTPNPLPPVAQVCADLAPLQSTIKLAAAIVPNLAAQVALQAAQATEQGICLNPAQVQAMIDRLNAAVAARAG